MERDLKKLYDIYQNMRVNENKEFIPKIRKGEEVPVKLMYLKGQPDSTVTAYDNSWYNEHSKSEAFFEWRNSKYFKRF